MGTPETLGGRLRKISASGGRGVLPVGEWDNLQKVIVLETDSQPLTPKGNHKRTRKTYQVLYENDDETAGDVLIQEAKTIVEEE